MGAWIGAIAAVVGAAAFGGRTTETPAPSTAVVAPSTTPSVGPDRSVRLDQPARPDEVVRTREIVVRGHVQKGVAQVWITLEGSGRPIATRSIDPIGMPRNNMIPFEARFLVERPRPAGPLFVMVVAIGSDGVPIDAMRRRFMLGESLELRGPVTGGAAGATD